MMFRHAGVRRFFFFSGGFAVSASVRIVAVLARLTRQNMTACPREASLELTEHRRHRSLAC